MRTILIVDDEPPARYGMRRVLEGNYRIVEAESASTARATAAREHPDLILLDVVMPDEDGLAFLRGLRESGDQTPVLIVSALDTARTNVDSLKAKILLAKDQVTASEARVLEAQQGVDNCVIRAPFSGVVVSKDAQVGEMVSPISAGGGFTRTGIATIVDMKSNEIEVDVNEAYIARVYPGQKVMATLDAYPDWHIPSHVRTIIPTADRDKGTVKVRISFDKLDPKILPDMGVKVAFLSEADSSKKAKAQGPAARAIIPQAAVRVAGADSYVFAVHDGKIERRAVPLGRTISKQVEVTAGVNPGDELVVQGPDNLHDGMKVEIRQ